MFHNVELVDRTIYSQKMLVPGGEGVDGSIFMEGSHVRNACSID